MNNLLTVVVPVYNDSANISRCLKSLFNQTFSAMEIIVVNDASTDDTLEVLKAYQQDHQFQIINMKENSGAGCCRNVGILKSTTPYVTFIDSDDWVDIDTYSKCFELISNWPDVIIFGLVYDYLQHNHREEKYHYSRVYKIPGEFALGIYAHTIPNEINITPIVNNKIYRKQFLQDKGIQFHELLRYQEDDVFTFEVLAQAGMVVFVNGCNYHYYQRSDSLIHNVSEAAIRGFVTAYKTLESNLKFHNLFAQLKDAYYLKLKGSLLGVIKRILDYEPDTKKQNALLHLLLTLLINNFDFQEILETFNFALIRSIL